MEKAWVIFLISSGSPHVLRAHMGVHRTRSARPHNEIESAAAHGSLNGSRKVLLR